MPDPSEVDAYVADKIGSVNSIIATALESAGTFMEMLEDLGNLRPPYFIPNALNYTPDPIPIDATRPVAPTGIDAAVAGLSSGTMDPFSAKEITVPNADDIIPSDVFTNLPSLADFEAETPYESALLDALKLKLIDDIQTGATGLSPEAESAMATRRSERDDQIWADAADKLRNQFAAGGWDLPNGMLNAALLDLATKRADARLDASRDITVESFKMATENKRLAITQGIVLESALMQHFNNVADRASRFVLAKAELGMKLFTTVVEGYKAREEARLANVQLQVETEKGRIEVYLGQLQSLKVAADIAALKVDALTKKYSVDIQAYVAELGRAEASGRITVEQQRMVAQNYLSTFQAGLQMAKDNLEAFTQIAGIKVHAATAGGNIYANYIAAAINSLNAVMSMSAGYSETRTRDTNG